MKLTFCLSSSKAEVKEDTDDSDDEKPVVKTPKKKAKKTLAKVNEAKVLREKIAEMELG